MLNLKLSLVTSSGILLASKPDSLDDTEKTLATGLMAALISFSKEIHHRELESISYHDRSVSFVKVHEFVLIIETIFEEKNFSEIQVKNLLEHIQLNISPLLEGIDSETISEGAAGLILENCLLNIDSLPYNISQQPFVSAEKAHFTLNHQVKGWEIQNLTGSGDYIQKVALMLDSHNSKQKLEGGINSILNYIPEEKCCIYSIYISDGKITNVGIMKVPLSLGYILFRLFYLMTNTLKTSYLEGERDIEKLLSLLINLADPGKRISHLNLEDLSPVFVLKTLGNTLDKIIYPLVIGDGVLILGDKPTVRLVIDTMSLLTQHLEISTNAWVTGNDLLQGDNCILESRLSGMSFKEYNILMANKTPLHNLIIANLETGKAVNSKNSSSYFSNLFESLSRTNIIEASEKINIELEKLTSTALMITSYGFFDEKKAKQKMKEFSQKSNLPYIKIATELAIKANPLLDFLR